MFDGSYPKDKGKEGSSSTENYKVWSAVVQLALHTRNKLGFITGKCVRNENDGSLQEQWDMCNAVVLSWQFDSLVDLPACTCAGSDKFKEHVQLLRLIQFLMGLDDVFASVRTRSGSNSWVSNRSNNNTGCYTGNNNWNTNRNTSNAGSSNGNNNRSDPHTLTNDQYQRLKALLSGTSDTSKGFASVTGLNSKVPDGDWLPTDVLAGKSPYELVYNSEPSLFHLRTFGCLCFLTVFNETNKFASKSEKCVFVGYVFDKKGYKLFSLDNKKFLFLRDVKFYETVFPFKNKSITKDFVFEENGINDLIFFNENEDNTTSKSDEPYDDGGVSADVGRKSVPKTSTQNPNDNTVDVVSSDTSNQTDKSDTADITGSTSSRKVSSENEHVTETGVSDGIQGIELNDDEYEYEGEDIESFLFGWSSELEIGQTVRRSSRKTGLATKYQDYVLDKNVIWNQYCD
ncbi:ribonuclease H-like domain-containing protein [Tanacetum coccineum]